MSGPQGSDPTQPWSGQQPEQPDQPDQPPSETGQTPEQQQWQTPESGAEQPGADPQQWQPPAYGQQQYPQYQQPAQPGYPPQQYPPAGQFGQPPTEYTPGYAQPPGQPPYGQYGQAPGQFGAPQQYGQQPGQPGQFGQQPGQFGQYPPYPQPGADDGSKRPTGLIAIIGGVAAVAVIAFLITAFWVPGFLVTTKLDVDAAQTGVQRVLTDETNGYGATNVRDVTCNGGESPVVQQGSTFDCEVSIDGTMRRVTVTFQDNDGTFEVGRPR